MGELASSARLSLGGLRADLCCLPLGMEGELGLVGLSAHLGWVPLRREGLCITLQSYQLQEEHPSIHNMLPYAYYGYNVQIYAVPLFIK